MLEGLDNVEVRALALREAVLAVKLELSSHDRVLTPAVHVKGSLGKHEGAGIRDGGAVGSRGREGGLSKTALVLPLASSTTSSRNIISTSKGEEARAVDEAKAASGGGLVRSAESVDGIGKGINGISVVEGLGTKGLEEDTTGIEGRAVVDVGIRLDNPDKLLARVVEVELDLVGGGTHRLVTSELELLNEVLVGVLGHLAALVSVEENVVDVEGGSNKGLLVSSSDGLGASTSAGGKGLDGPQALTNGAEINVDLHLVVLESNEGEGKARVAAKPEEEGNVEGGLRESLARSTNLGRSAGSRAGARDLGEGRVADVGKLGGVTNHLVVSAALLLRHGHLVPDVHPVTVLAVNALATNLNLNLSDELLTREIEPTSINTVSAGGHHALVDLRESHLEVGAVAKITVAADGAGDTATEIGLSREGLLDGLHGEVSVASVRHLPESNFRGTSKENVLGPIGDKLH